MENNKVYAKQMKINIGPQHPSTHGVLRLILDLEGEIIKNTEVKIGYLHRGLEKMAESRSFLQYLPLVDRIDYLSSFFCSQAFCAAVESLCLIDEQIPIKAHYIRVLLMELNRIASHLLWLGTFLLDLGASSIFFYCFKEREKIIRIFESITGARMMYNFFKFGGVKSDIKVDDLESIEQFTLSFITELKICENIITDNPIFYLRTKNIGILDSKTALNYSITGANLRSSGICLDFRKSRPYAIYNKIDFKTPIKFDGDSYSRYITRIEEMKQSICIIKQCIDWLKSNRDLPFALDINQILLKSKSYDNTATSYVESPRGLLSCSVFANKGDERPNRVKWRTGSFYAVQVLPLLLEDMEYADLMSIFGSLDIVLPEVDR